MKQNETMWLLVHKRTIPTELPPLVGNVITTYVGRECRVVSAMDL
jgi:hypothetical protein